MKYLTILVIIATLISCKSQEELNNRDRLRGEAAVKLFKSCMELAASTNKAATQPHIDLDEVIYECTVRMSLLADKLHP